MIVTAENKVKRSVFFIAVLVVVGLLLISGVAAANQNESTIVTLELKELTINVDSTVAGWGYTVKVGDVIEDHTEETYKVVFGSDKDLIQILVNGSTGLPAGWYLSVTSENCSYEIPENPLDPDNRNLVKVYDFTADAASVTITAHNGNTVTVAFDAAGGSPTPDAQTVYYGETITEPSAPSLSRYTFLGWYNGTDKWNFADPVYADMTLKASWRYNGGGGGGGGGSTPVVEPELPDVVDEVEEEVVFQDEIVISVLDEDGNIVDLPIEKLVMSDEVIGTVDLKDVTAEVNDISIIPSLQETAQYIAEYRVETIAEAVEYGIPVYENYIGGNGHAPVLIEDTTSSEHQVQFWKVIEITTDVTGGELQEIIFSVPLDELKEQGYTMTDVVLYHGVTENGQRIWYPLVTTVEWFDDTYAYYKAVTDGASPFGIMFLKDSTCVTPVSPDEPVTPVETPFGLIGVITGLGAAAFFLRRR